MTIMISVKNPEDKAKEITKLQAQRWKSGYPMPLDILIAVKSGKINQGGPQWDVEITQGKEYTVWDNIDMIDGHFHIRGDNKFVACLEEDVLEEYFNVKILPLLNITDKDIENYQKVKAEREEELVDKIRKRFKRQQKEAVKSFQKWLKEEHTFDYRRMKIPKVTIELLEGDLFGSRRCKFIFYLNGKRIRGYILEFPPIHVEVGTYYGRFNWKFGDRLGRHLPYIQDGIQKADKETIRKFIHKHFGVLPLDKVYPKRSYTPIHVGMGMSLTGFAEELKEGRVGGKGKI